MSEIGNEMAWLGSLLSSASARHRAVSANIANANTPGYRPLRVRFEETLRDMIRSDRKVDLKKLAALRPELHQAEGIHAARGVEIDHEVMTLMKNQLAYDTYAAVLTMKMNQLKTAIRSSPRGA
jgi:flagellar basal-body rod protein FlgB